MDFVFELVTVYGPLGLGWVLWWFDRKAAEKRDQAREDLLRESLNNSTVAVTTLGERLRGAINSNTIILREDQ